MFLRKPGYDIRSIIQATIDEVIFGHRSNEYNNEAVSCLLCLAAGSDNPKEILSLICNHPELKVNQCHLYFSYVNEVFNDEKEFQSFLSRFKKLDLEGFKVRMETNEEFEGGHVALIYRKP